MLGVSPDNVVAHDRGEPPSDDGPGVVLVRTRPDPTVAREGLDRVRVVRTDEDRYRVDYRGDRAGRLVVTRAGVAELGAALLADADPVPAWLLTESDAVPWWAPDGYDGRPTVRCDRCGAATDAADLLVPGRGRGGDERFCPDCWGRVRGRWSPEASEPCVAALVADLDATDPVTRRVAASELRTAAETRPAAVRDAAAALAAHVECDDPVVRAGAFAALGAVAEDAPHRTTPAAAAAVVALDDPEDEVVAGAARVVAGVATDRPDAVLDAVPRVAALLESGTAPNAPLVRTLERVGAAYPSAVLPAVESLLAHAESAADAGPSDEGARARETEDEEQRDSSEARTASLRTAVGDGARGGSPETPTVALAAVGRVAASHPGAVESAVPRLTGLFDADAAAVRAAAARVLADVADHRPDAVVPAAERVVSLVDDDDETARREATSVLAGLARTAPERVREAGAGESLVGALSAEFTCTRSNAAWLLGRIGAGEARDALVERRRADPAAEVREAAAWALDRLEGSDAESDRTEFS